MDVVYARNDMTVVWSRGVTLTRVGDVWAADAPLVRERPELFAVEPTLVRGGLERPVEPKTPKDKAPAPVPESAKGDQKAGS